MSWEQFVQYLMTGLTAGCIYALVGLGFTIVYAVTGIINFAQGEFVMLGGMISYELAVSAGMPLWPAVLLSVLIAAAVGALLYVLGIRPARKASLVSLIIITIGASILIRGVAGELWGKNPVRPPAFSGEEALQILGARIQPQAIWIIGATFVIMIILHVFFAYTMMGKALKASSVSRLGAGLVGIDTRMMALAGFCLAAMLGGIAGVITAPLTTTSYSMGAMLGVKGFVAAAIGGFKSQLAAVVGGIAIGIIESFVVAANWGPFTSNYKDAIALIVLLVILLVRSGRIASEERAS
ncbi:MAG: branched-chain amino acid ABC transporter permease [Chloroflexi bacterium]|nr:branched-chain amino acid ABC transporter permease [Chloroflexota bacterium]